MTNEKNIFSQRLVLSIKKLILYQAVITAIAVFGFSFYYLTNQTFMVEKAINLPLKKTIGKMISYGELLYLQPVLQSTSDSVENNFQIYISLKKIDGEIVSFSGQEEAQKNFFKRESISTFEAPYFGNLTLNLVIGYDHQVYLALLAFVITLALVCAISFVLMVRINSIILTNSLGVDELEQIIQRDDTFVAPIETLSRAKKLINDHLESRVKFSTNEAIAFQARQVAHDIRSPLTTIKFVFESLKDLPAEQSSLLVSAIDKVSTIANELLLKHKDLSKSSDVLKKQFKKINLIRLLELVFEEKKIEFSKLVNCELIFESENLLDIYVEVDPIDFSRALSNLINNSVESLNSGPGKIQINVEQSEGIAQVEIVDNGCGIPEPVLSKLGREEVSSKQSVLSGNGVGFYSANKTIKDCNGHIEVHSKLGSGTRVSISLPVSRS